MWLLCCIKALIRIKPYIDPFNVCKHRKPRLGARAAWGQKNGAANRPAYCVKEKQTSLIDREDTFLLLFVPFHFCLGCLALFCVHKQGGHKFRTTGVKLCLSYQK